MPLYSLFAEAAWRGVPGIADRDGPARHLTLASTGRPSQPLRIPSAAAFVMPEHHDVRSNNMASHRLHLATRPDHSID